MQERVVNPGFDRTSRAAEHTVFAVIVAVSICHLLNDMMQALLPAIYPIIKDRFLLSFGQIGLITLVGLVSKNGILIVEFANTLQESGKTKLNAVIEAAGTRLRPILMTSVATVAGHFPLVLARGPGAGSRNSIGTVLVSGMMIGTLFTLFVVPSIYMLLARDRALHPRVAEVEEPDLASVTEAASLRRDILLAEGD